MGNHTIKYKPQKMKKLILLLSILASSFMAYAQDTVTANQKQAALTQAQKFCSSLIHFCQNDRTSDKQIFSLCTGRNCSVYDDINGQESTLSSYLMAIQKKYPKTVSLSLSQPTLSSCQIYYDPEFNVNSVMGSITTTSQHDPLQQNEVLQFNRRGVKNAYIVFPITVKLGNIVQNQRLLIYDLKEGRISAFVNGSGTYISYLQAMNHIIDGQYRLAIPLLKNAASNNRASFRSESLNLEAYCHVFLGEWDLVAPCYEDMNMPLEANFFKGMAQFIKHDYNAAIMHLKKAESLIDDNSNPGVIQELYGGLLSAYLAIENYSTALKYYRLSIQKGNYKVPIIGAVFSINKLLPIPEDEMKRNLNWAAAQGHSGSIFLSAVLENNKTKSMEWFRKGAQNGDAMCMANLGRNLLASNNPKDINEGRMWLKESLNDKGFTFQIKTYLNFGIDKIWPWTINDVEELLKQSENNSATYSQNNSTSETSPTVISRSSDNHRSNVSQPTSTRNSATRTNNNYKVKRYNSFNDSKDEYVWSFSLGYVQKQWEYSDDQGNVEKYGIFSDADDEYVNGIQVGFRYEPQFGHGFGLNTGLFYEYYWYNADAYNGIRCEWEEHSLYLPVDFEFHLNFHEYFQLFAFGGISADCGLYSKIDYVDDAYDDVLETEEDIYNNENELNRFNFSYEYGGGIRIKNFQLQYSVTKGLIDMAVKGSDYKVKQNRPMMLSVSFMF